MTIYTVDALPIGTDRELPDHVGLEETIEESGDICIIFTNKDSAIAYCKARNRDATQYEYYVVTRQSTERGTFVVVDVAKYLYTEVIN